MQEQNSNKFCFKSCSSKSMQKQILQAQRLPQMRTTRKIEP